MAVKSLSPQQLRAVEVEKNAVVSAGAGSGKTTVLVQRFLRLVREGRAEADQILTLTFTRKAATEMYERIHRQLLAHREDPRVSRQLPRFDKAQISTLDSFCSQIVRGDCSRFGLPGDFLLDSRDTSRTLASAEGLAERTALDFLLKHKDHPAMIRLLDLNGFTRTWREFWAALAKTTFSLVKPPAFEALARKQIETGIARLGEILPRIEGYREAVMELNPKAGKTVEALQKVFRGMEDLSDGVTRGEWGRIEAAVRRFQGLRTPGKATKKDMTLAKEYILELKDMALDAVEYCVLLANEDYLLGIASLAKEYQEDFLKAKRRTGTLTFQDVMELAVEILKTNPPLRNFYKTRFRYIMIDEFQDNNIPQRELLYLLGEREDRQEEGVPGPEDLHPGKLYFVGDEKQSIYRFRGADVSVFKGLKAEIAAGGGEVLELNTNYRSEPGLIDFFNRIFPRIMEEEEHPFEAEFRPLKSRPPLLSEPSQIRFFLGLPMDEEEAAVSLPPKEREAYTLAKTILEEVGGGELGISREAGEGSADFDDFAVLLRSTGSQGLYERWFRLLDIPYEVQNLRSFYLEAPVNDIYALLQTVVYPTDTLAYAVFLRSPLVSLSDDSLSALLLADLPPFAEEGEALMLREEDRRAHRRGAELFHWCADSADSMPLPALLEELWFRRGYRYTLLQDSAYHGYLDYFDYLWALAQEAEERGLPLSRFLDDLRPSLGTYERLGDVPVQRRRRPGVKIMTIHAAKGLEFPVTILGDCGAETRKGRQGAAPFYFSPEFGLTLKLEGSTDGAAAEKVNPFYRAAREENQAQEEAELKRLLYVALTRGKNHLFLAGETKKTKFDTGHSLLDLFLRGFGITEVEEIRRHPVLASHLTLMEPVARDEVICLKDFQRRRSLEEAAALYAADPGRPCRFLRRNWGVTDYVEEERQRVPGTEGRSDGRSLPPLACDPLLEELGWEASFGTLCHLLIEKRIKGFLPPGRVEALLEELPPERRGQVRAEAESLVLRFFDSPLGRSLSGAIRTESEYSFLLKKDLEGRKVFLRGKIDLLLEFPEEALVVDFKTDRIEIPGEHREQLSLYCEAAAALTGKSVRPILCYLRNGFLREIHP